MLKEIMKRQIFNLILSLIILVISGCRQDSATTLLKFKAYEQNPILSPGEPGSWDELFVSAPQIIYFEKLFYLFYMGCNVPGKMAVGLATSKDGFHFIKFPDNPVLAPDDSGFDAYTAAVGVLVQNDSVWVMYYNGNELATYSPGPAIGRATAAHLTGPWIKDEIPVLYSGSIGEWDAGFVIPSSVIRLEDGNYRMYYSGGTEITLWNGFFTGMAASTDGINWKKYNDPTTSKHPFAESDPVLMPGNAGDWDGAYVWMANVNRYPEDFRMYYTGIQVKNKKELMAIGFASSRDGIKWDKYSGNPVFTSQSDPVISQIGIDASIENPCILLLDSISYIYYDFTLKEMESHAIGMATSFVN
jgi:hypothetical protein